MAASPRLASIGSMYNVSVLASLPKPSHERHMAFWYTPAGDGWSLPAWRHQPSCTALVVVQVQGRTPPVQPRQLLYQATAAPIDPSIHPALRRKPNALPARAVSPQVDCVAAAWPVRCLALSAHRGIGGQIFIICLRVLPTGGLWISPRWPFVLSSFATALEGP